MVDMKFAILTGIDGNIIDAYEAKEILVYKRRNEVWSMDEVHSLNCTCPTNKQDIEVLFTELCEYLNKNCCKVLIAKSMVGLLFQLFDRTNMIVLEADEINSELLEEIHQDFFVQDQQGETVQPKVPSKPVMIAEDGFYYFDFDEVCKIYPDLSSKQMLQPFLMEELFTALTIKCSHIMPWLQNFTAAKGMSMEVKEVEQKFHILITHGLCKKERN